MGYSCEFGSNKYFALCAFGGVLSCGITHTLVTPLDLVKCRLQVDKEKYKSVGNGFKLTVAEQGVRGLFLGWAPTLIGYSMQGLCKFGFYEFFKNTYSNMIGEENTYLYKTSLYLAASASAEFFADIALSPMEAVKVKMQTSKLGTFPTTLRGAAPTLYRAEGLNGFYKSLVPLWGRQIPYTMMKFACFERTVEAIYAYVVPKPRDQCQVRTAGGHICCWLHCWCLLCHRLSPGRHPGLVHEQGAGCHPWLWSQGSWIQGTVGRTWPKDRYDRYTYRPPMVHLRCSEGATASATTTASPDAREPEKETWGRPRIGNHLNLTKYRVSAPAHPKCHHSVEFKYVTSAFKFIRG